MRMILLLVAAFAAHAHAEDTVVVAQAQPLAPTPGARNGSGTEAMSKAVASPKIHEVVATRNADGTIAVGCAERPNPVAGKPPINTISPEPEQ